MTSDPIRDAIRRLDPVRTEISAPIPLSAERRLQEIIRKRPEPKRKRRHFVVPGLVAASIACIFIVFATGVWGPGPAAQAQTPAALSYFAATSDSVDAVNEAQKRLATGDDGSLPLRRSVSEGWYFSGTPDSSGPVLIRRERVELQWNADLSGSVQTSIASVTTPGGVVVDDPEPAVGSLVQEVTFGPSEFSVVSVDSPGSNPDSMSAWLRADRGVTEELRAGEVILGIQSMLGQWTLTDSQEAALLDVLADAPGVHVLGTTHDRLGRPVVGVAAVPDSNPQHEVTLLLSLDTGRIVGFESSLRTEDESLGLPSGSVMAYTLWEVDN